MNAWQVTKKDLKLLIRDKAAARKTTKIAGMILFFGDWPRIFSARRSTAKQFKKIRPMSQEK